MESKLSEKITVGVLTALLGMCVVLLWWQVSRHGGEYSTVPAVTAVNTDRGAHSLPLIPSPVSTIEWSLQIGGPYGAGKGSDGVKGLEFAFDSRSPVQATQWGRTYISNTIAGVVMPTTNVSAAPPYTFTAGIDDSDVPDRFTFFVDCPVAFTGVYTDYLSVGGVLQTMDCGTIGSHTPCRFTGHLVTVGGQTCPGGMGAGR